MDDRDRNAAHDRIARAFVSGVPQVAELGVTVARTAAGEVELCLPWRADLVGDPATGVIHGGAVFTLMDTASGAAVLAHPQVTGPTATLDLRIDYMRAASPHQTIRARAECHHVTRNVAFVRAVALDDDDSRPVATATGSFTLAGDVK
ncbi:MAG: PaaI family thioesterase [Rubellimicrobium sp.]|nr:PaaI family thioesterase [Rubellimicrobium sp.]